MPLPLASPLDLAQNAHSYTDLANLQAAFQARQAEQLGNLAMLPGNLIQQGQQLQSGQLALQGAQRQQAIMALGLATPSTYDAIRQQAVSNAPSLDAILPQQYDPNFVASAQNALITPDKRAELAQAAATLAETTRADKAKEFNESGGFSLPGSSASSIPVTGSNAVAGDLSNPSQAVTNVLSPQAQASIGTALGNAPVPAPPGIDMSDAAMGGQNTAPGNQFAGPGSPAQPVSTPLHGDDFLTALQQSNPNAPVGAIKAMANGDLPIPTGRSMANPINMKLLSAAMQANPNLNAQTYAVKQAFDTGPQGDQVRFLNVATSHLALLQQLGDALKNGNLPLINELSNTWKEQTGQDAPTNFDALKQLATSEVVKAAAGGVTGVGDRKEAGDQMSAASSPQQILGTIGTYKGAMGAQLQGLAKQYQSSTGLNDFNNKLFPETVAQLSQENSPSLSPSALKSIPTQALTALKANPALAPQFDQKYGQGASKMLMGGS